MENTEQSYWVQQIAPAGNFYDVLGTGDDLKAAQDYAKYTRGQGYKTRIVLRTDVVIDPAS